MRWLAGLLLLLLLGLQYRLWVGQGSLAELQALRDEIGSQKQELVQMQARNQTLEAEVQDLREGLDALEERARSELGMIKQGEMFLQVIGEPDDSEPERTPSTADTRAPAEGKTDNRSPAGDSDAGLARREIAADAARAP
jgi:cell division protein FtsB